MNDAVLNAVLDLCEDHDWFIRKTMAKKLFKILRNLQPNTVDELFFNAVFLILEKQIWSCM